MNEALSNTKTIHVRQRLQKAAPPGDQSVMAKTYVIGLRPSTELPLRTGNAALRSRDLP